MLLYLMFLHAEHHIIMHDETHTPLNSTKPFASAKHRMLYELILNRTINYHMTEEWFDVLNGFRDYMCKFAKDHPSRPFVPGIKRILITHILQKYQLREFHVGMLDFASDFDADLREHCNVLCEYNTEEMQKSLVKFIKDFEEPDYKLNRSASFIAQLHTHLMFEIVSSELEQSRWFRDNEFFVKTYFKDSFAFLRHKELFVNEVVKYLTINFDLDNFVDLHSNVKKLVNRIGDKRTRIHAIYTLSNVVDVFDERPVYIYQSLRKGKWKKFKKIQEKMKDMVKLVDLKTSQIDAFVANYREMCTIDKLYHAVINARNLTRYEYFFCLRDVSSKNTTLESWKEYVVAYQKRINDLRYQVLRIQQRGLGGR